MFPNNRKRKEKRHASNVIEVHSCESNSCIKEAACSLKHQRTFPRKAVFLAEERPREIYRFMRSKVKG